MKLVLTADWHLREDVPSCRLETEEEFQEEQLRKLTFMCDVSRDNEAPILCAGDVTHRWKIASHEFMSRVIGVLRRACVYCIPGNHDLPCHSPALYSKSALHELETAGAVTLVSPEDEFVMGDVVLVPAWWGTGLGEISQRTRLAEDFHVLLWHAPVYKDDNPYKFAGTTCYEAKRVLKKLRQFDLILTGDNHIPFIHTRKGRVLVNPGSLMRSDIRQRDYVPHVVLYDTVTRDLQRIPIPLAPADKCMQAASVKQERTAFVSSVEASDDAQSFDFVEYCSTRSEHLPEPVKAQVLRLLTGMQRSET